MRRIEMDCLLLLARMLPSRGTYIVVQIEDVTDCIYLFSFSPAQSLHVTISLSHPATHSISLFHYRPLTLSSSLSLSRHAEIFWDSSERTFFIKNITSPKSLQPGVRTGGSVYVRGEELLPGGVAVALRSQSIVQIGSVIFTFVLPSTKALANKQDFDVRK